MRGQKWTGSETQALVSAFGSGSRFELFMAERTAAYMEGLDAGTVVAKSPPESIVVKASKATGRSREQVLSRIMCLVRIDLGLSTAVESRTERRETLSEYARAGIRTLAEIRAEDARRAAKPTEPTPTALPLPEAKSAAPVDEFAELRAARQAYREARAVHLAAIARADAADAAAKSAHTALDAASDAWSEASRNLESIIDRLREVK